MNFVEFKEIIVKYSNEKGIEDYELYFSNSKRTSMNVYNQELDKLVYSDNIGICYRCIIENKAGYSSTQDMTEESAKEIVLNAYNNAVMIQVDSKELIYDKVYSIEPQNDFFEKLDFTSVSSELIDLEKYCYALDKNITSIPTLSFSHTFMTVNLYNSNGLDLSKSNNILSTYISIAVKDKDKTYSGYGYNFSNFYKDLNFEYAVQLAYKDAISSINYETIKTGSYKTMFNNRSMGILLDAFSPIFSADNVLKGLSLLKENTVIASKQLNIIDDPNYKNSKLKIPFDDEGVKTYSKDIVSEGTLKTLLYDLKTAIKLNKTSTGNGIRDSYNSPIKTAPTNLYIKPGDYTFEDLVEKLDFGVIITDLKGIHAGANSITGDFSLESKGFYVEGGKLKYPLNSITIAGNFYDIIKNIEYIGNDSNFMYINSSSSIETPSIVFKKLDVSSD